MDITKDLHIYTVMSFDSSVTTTNAPTTTSHSLLSGTSTMGAFFAKGLTTHDPRNIILTRKVFTIMTIVRNTTFLATDRRSVCRSIINSSLFVQLNSLLKRLKSLFCVFYRDFLIFFKTFENKHKTKIIYTIYIVNIVNYILSSL